LWGILGGLEWRRALDSTGEPAKSREHLQRSIEAYDKGYKYENESSSSGTSTYNKLNRLLVRLLLDPKLLAPAGGPRDKAMNVRTELEEVGEQLSQHAADNVWFAADMALINVLLGRQDAVSAYAYFERMKPPDFVRQSARDVLIPLAELNLLSSAGLRDAVNLLDARRV
jgi:hypothetical protein